MTYLWYMGKVWIDEGLKDHEGRLLLVNPLDHSAGILAEPENTREVSQADAEAMDRFVAARP